MGFQGLSIDIHPSRKHTSIVFVLQPPPSLPKMYEGSATTVAFDRSSGIAALCIENYCIQLYSLLNDRGISEVQVCETNHQPGDEITIWVCNSEKNQTVEDSNSKLKRRNQ